MVAQTRHSGAASPSKKKLAFNEKLVGKGLSTDALLKKLKALHTELAALDQDSVNVSSLNTSKKELINTSILLHKDRGVKAYAACCLADILRLYAPDAPYTQLDLRDIFQFFFRQLTAGLKGADATYYDQYFHLLESLSTVKSVVLVCDLPNAEELMSEIFRDFFNLVRRDLPKKMEIFLADILTALIDECQVVPTEALETLLSQFMENNTKIEQAGLRLAIQVCNATSDKLQRHVSQHFTDLILANSEAEEERDFNEIKNAHLLIKRLNHSCSGLLSSVIPQLEEEMKAEDADLRVIVTQVLGEMFADKGGNDLVKKYPSTWGLWLQRKLDKSTAVRLKFVEAIKGLFVNPFEQREAIEDALKSKILDPDEKVRAAVCRIFGQLDYETALHHVSEEMLTSVGERAADKRQSVRVEALTSLGKLYSSAYPEIENNEPLAIKKFAWIPKEILSKMNLGTEVLAIAEQTVMDYILPLPSTTAPSTSKGAGEVDEAAWTDRLLLTMKYLDDLSMNSLFSLSGLRQVRPSIYDHLAEACIKNNGGVIDENEEAITRRLDVVIKHVAGNFPDPLKAVEDLRAYAKLNEGRLYKLWKTCMDPQTDIKSLIKATAEFQKRVDQQASSQAATLNILLRRSSFRIVNQSCITTLIKRLQKGAGVTAKNAKLLLQFISKHQPTLYQSHVPELTKAIAQQEDKNSSLVEICLQALAGVMVWDAEREKKLLSSFDKRTIERVSRFAVGDNWRHAKFAARILAALGKEDSDPCNSIIEAISENLPEASGEQLAAHIAVLAQLARLAPASFESKSADIVSFLLKKIVMVPIPPDPNDMEDDEEWVPDEDVSPRLRAKVLCLKVCRNRCLAQAKSETAMDIATPVLKLLATVLEHSGALNEDAPEDPKVMSRMRLQAAVSLAHLSTVEAYANAIKPKFLRLAVTIQDSCYNVRFIFLAKLITLLTPRKLPAQYNVIPFLSVHDPELDVKQKAVNYITSATRRLPPNVRTEHLEFIFFRLLLLLAHHPDFNKTHEDLQDMAKYIQFYVQHVATSENVSLLHHLAQKGKTVRDAESHTHTENLYVISELAEELVKVYAKQKSWNLESYPGKVRLPNDLLRPLPGAEAAKEISKTQYLPEETRAWAADLLKPRQTVPKEKKERKVPAKRKASVSKANGTSKRSRPTKKRWNSDDESEEEAPSEFDSGEEVEQVPPSDPKVISEPEDDEAEDDGEQQLGRGARTRAKTRSSRRARAPAKQAEGDMEE